MQAGGCIGHHGQMDIVECKVQYSTSPCPTDSCRNGSIPLESAGMAQESTGMGRNPQELNQNGLEWTGMSQEWTKMDILELRI